MIEKGPDFIPGEQKTAKSEGYVVGAVKKSDGSWDYSRAIQESEALDKSAIAEEKAKLESQYKSELSPEQREILEAVDKRGRLVVHTVMTPNLCKERRANSGFQDIIDQKSDDQNVNIRLRQLHVRPNTKNPDNVFQVPMFHQFLGKQNINTAITIEQLTKEVPIYTETEENKGLIFKKKKIVRQQTGIKKEPITMGYLNGNDKDSESAYRIVYFVVGTDEKPYIDPATHRTGGQFIGNIMLPKSVAKNAFAEIEKDPSFAKIILEKLDPKLIQEQLYPKDDPSLIEKMGRTSYMPEGDKVLIIPEGKAFDAFERNDRKIAQRIKPDYIKSIK